MIKNYLLLKPNLSLSMCQGKIHWEYEYLNSIPKPSNDRLYLKKWFSSNLMKVGLYEILM